MLSNEELAYVKEIIPLLQNVAMPVSLCCCCTPRKIESIVLARAVCAILGYVVTNRSYEDQSRDPAINAERRRFVQNLRNLPCPCIWETSFPKNRDGVSTADTLATLFEGLWMLRLI